MSAGAIEVLTVTRRYNAARDLVPAPQLMGTPRRQWVVAMVCWPTGWHEVVYPSLEHAARSAELQGMAFFVRLRRRSGVTL